MRNLSFYFPLNKAHVQALHSTEMPPQSVSSRNLRNLRNRLGNLSDSMMNILNLAESKEKESLPHHGKQVLVSRLVVFLFGASLVMIFLNATIHTLSSFRSKSHTAPSSGTSISHLLHSGLSASDYPSVLVADSKPFVPPKSESTDDSKSSLVPAVSDSEITRAANVDSDEEPVARMIVMTMDRDQSLKRLLNSLAAANYGEDHVDLDIWIDVGEEKVVHEGVLTVCRSTEWRQGTKTIHKRAVNAGLFEQWIYTWNITAETTEFAVILEDDLEVSPAFYQWLRVARAAYAQDPDVGAFTLQRSTLRPRQIKGVASGDLSIPAEHSVFKYKLLGTWGFAPQRDQWVEFRKWFEAKKARGEKPYVENLVTTKWYKSQEVNGFAPTMWSQWWIKFVDEKGYFTVTAHLPDGTTLAANWRESGLHYSKSEPSADFSVFQGNDEQFVMPDNPILVDWDGQIMQPDSKMTS